MQADSDAGLQRTTQRRLRGRAPPIINPSDVTAGGGHACSPQEDSQTHSRYDLPVVINCDKEGCWSSSGAVQVGVARARGQGPGGAAGGGPRWWGLAQPAAAGRAVHAGDAAAHRPAEPVLRRPPGPPRRAGGSAAAPRQPAVPGPQQALRAVTISRLVEGLTSRWADGFMERHADEWADGGSRCMC